MNWDEYEVAELGRLMITAGNLETDLRELSLPLIADDDEEMVDARYHAHKLYRILARLAVQAEREWKQSQAETGE